MTDEVRHLFRLVLLGSLVFAIFAAAGTTINYYQQREIKDTQEKLRRSTTALLRRDCNLVVATANVFTDFIKVEIQLRAARATSPQASAAIRAFDTAEVRYWARHTLPQLNRVYAVHCHSFDLGH
jgi:hypothetical protein